MYTHTPRRISKNHLLYSGNLKMLLNSILEFLIEFNSSIPFNIEIIEVKMKITLFFLLSSIFCIRRKYWNLENFQLPVFGGIYTIWNALNTISQFIQNVCFSVCDTNFVPALAQKLIDGIAFNFKLNCILT